MEPKGEVEIPLHPSEATAAQTPLSPEVNKEVLASQRVKEALGKGVDLIKDKKDSVFFDAGDKADAKKDVETVLTQAEQRKLDSDGLRAFFSATSSIGAEAIDIEKAASENMRIKVGNRILTLDQWRAELNVLRNPPDGAPVDPQKAEEIKQKISELEAGDFAYEFVQEESAKQEKSPEDIVISRHRKSFEEQFKKAEERGDVPKEQLEKIGETLVMLRLAKEANGEAGIILKHLALKNLEENHGAQGLDDSIENLGKQAAESMNKVYELMEPGKAEEFRNAIKEGKLEDLITSGKLLKIERMRELLFGKDMTEAKLKEILDLNKKKKWGNALLTVLIIMLIGPMELGKQVVPMPGGN